MYLTTEQRECFRSASDNLIELNRVAPQYLIYEIRSSGIIDKLIECVSILQDIYNQSFHLQSNEKSAIIR